ncbi:sugar ABC transporter permease [Spirochaetia bacterium]|nr:sugar ABC transporter permease [Spirochaetia bacterium]
MLYPLIQTFVFSFSTLTLPKFDVKFNGFSNFTRIFSRMEVPQIIFNTIVWTLGAVIMRITFGMLTALVMNANVPGIKVLRVIVLIPWTVPSIVAANSWRWIYQGDFGVINGMLKSWGLTPYPWIGSVDTAMGAILVASTWAGYPFVMMMLLAAMQGLSQDHFEAAMVDGANAIQRFWHITLPGIKPVIVVLIALETINAINSFDMIFNLTGGGPGNATEIIGLFIYRIGFTLLDFAGASAVSVVLILVALMLFVVYVVLQQAAGKSGEIKG